ncbi:MAG: hypothetical protein AAB014_01145 [Nitrospirota bacterium]
MEISEKATGGILLKYQGEINTHGFASGYLSSEQREREGEAPRALPVEGATLAP